MKNTFKLFAIITMAAVIALSMTACGDPGDDDVPKTLLITGIPKTDTTNSVTLENKQVTVAIFNTKGSNNKPNIVALDQLKITFPASATTTYITSQLVSGNDKKNGAPFTGTGNFYICLFIDDSTPSSLDDDATYYYGGKGGLMEKQLPITNAVTQLAWDEFFKK